MSDANEVGEMAYHFEPPVETFCILLCFVFVCLEESKKGRESRGEKLFFTSIFPHLTINLPL